MNSTANRMEQEQYSTSGTTRTIEHPHPDIHKYKFTEEEIFSITNIDDEKKHRDRFIFLLGIGVPCLISAAVSYYECNKSWIIYGITALITIIFSILSRNDYKQASNKREQLLNKIMDKRRVNSTAVIRAKE